MEPEVIEPEVSTATTALARRLPADVVLQPVMNVKLAKERLKELQDFCANYLQVSKDGGTDGGDYGVLPGAGSKMVLLKSGAEKLCDVYGLADKFKILTKVEDFEQGLFDYTLVCELYRKTDGMFVGSGMGACSSFESKYRWRNSQRSCPNCHQETIIKGRAEYGGGWVCWKKGGGGCGAKFVDADPAIVKQVVGRVMNPDIIDTKNTVLKMAKKRAKIDAVISVTRSSGLFSQDLEEHLDAGDVEAAPSVPASGKHPGEPPHAHGPGQAAHRESQAKSAEAPANETHAEKMKRLKQEAAAKKPAAPVPEPNKAPASEPPVPDDADGPYETWEGPDPEVESTRPTEAVYADGQRVGGVRVTSIKTKNGKNAQGRPWILYIVGFSEKVKASDGVMVTDATTFSESLAKKAEDARDDQSLVVPVIEAAKERKGTYTLTELS